jgi:DNA-binding MarR family transcriptional regulator
MDKEEQVIISFRDLLNKWASLNKFKMQVSLKGYKSSEIHCIEYIGSNPDSNVTNLAEAFDVTRGAISKIMAELLQKGLIESYQKPDNKKEIYFRLTEPGKAINQVHEDLHKEFQARDKVVFDQLTAEQFESMLGFVEKYSRHLDAEIQKLGGDITPGNDSEWLFYDFKEGRQIRPQRSKSARQPRHRTPTH